MVLDSRPFHRATENQPRRRDEKAKIHYISFPVTSWQLPRLRGRYTGKRPLGWGLGKKIFHIQVQTALRLPTLTFQADCGSIKGAGVSAEEGTEHYLPWWCIHDKFNHCQRRNTESRRHVATLTAFLQTVISLGGHGLLAPLWIRH